MRTNVDFKKKVKNSFVYFQIGLIATMLVVLFVLEFQFKDAVKKVVVYDKPLHVEDVFTYNPVVVKPVEEIVKTVKPAVKVPTDIVKLKVEKNEVKIEKTNLPKQDITEPVVNGNEGKDEPNKNEANPTGPTKAAPTVFSVEQLPMFAACKGLSRAEQKACFDEQLAKAVSRYLEYPEVDYENGRQGTALIEFVIDENGNITNVKALENRRSTPEMNKAAEKAVKRIPKLIPAKQGDVNVSIKYALPITFKLQ